MKKVVASLAILLSIILVFVMLPVSGKASASNQSLAPRIPVKLSTSSNWSGYAVETNLKRPQKNSVNDVSGTWKVPAVTASSNYKGDTYSACWVGIDGYSDNTVEQIGTEQDYNYSTGKSTYYAWYEMYPGAMVQLDSGYPITAGDTVSAEVKYVGSSQFTLTLSDNNWPKSTAPFSITLTLKSAKRQSAEWIVEAPWLGGVLPLADFGQVNFSGVTFGSSVTSPSSWPADPITMIDGTSKATPTGLSSYVVPGSSNSFAVNWSEYTVSNPGHGKHGK